MHSTGYLHLSLIQLISMYNILQHEVMYTIKVLILMFILTQGHKMIKPDIW